MKVVLSGVTFLGSPVIWEYNAVTRTAVCTNRTTASKAPILFDVLARQLERTVGITVENGVILVKDTREFFINHPMREVVESNSPASSSTPSSSSTAFFVRRSNSDPSRESPKRPPDSPNTLAGSLSPRTVRFTLPDSETLIPSVKASTSTSRASEPPSSEPSTVDTDVSSIDTDRTTSPSFDDDVPDLCVDTLIPKTQSGSDLWGRTLCYENHFMEKGGTSSALKTQSMYIFSGASFTLKAQLTKGDDLYPLKKILTVKIRTLFDEYLNPVWQSLEHPEKHTVYPRLVQFFQMAIATALDNAALNKKPTQLESITSLEELAEKLPQMKRWIDRVTSMEELRRIPPAMITWQAAIRHERKAIARIMLMPLDFFADTYIQTLDDDIAGVLASLRDSISKNPELRQNISNCRRQMITAVVESGLTEQHCSVQVQTLKTELAEKKKHIENYDSFEGALEGFLNEHPASSTETFAELRTGLIKNTLRQCITTINSHLTTAGFKVNRETSFGIPGGALPPSTDFYLCKSWEAALQEHLQKNLTGTLDALYTALTQKPKGRSKKSAKGHSETIEALQNTFVFSVAGFFDKAILDVKRQPAPLSSSAPLPSTSSSSSSSTADSLSGGLCP